MSSGDGIPILSRLCGRQAHRPLRHPPTTNRHHAEPFLAQGALPHATWRRIAVVSFYVSVPDGFWRGPPYGLRFLAGTKPRRVTFLRGYALSLLSLDGVSVADVPDSP